MLKRIEIWCPTRTSAKHLYQQLKNEANKKQGHISLGQSYCDRRKKSGGANHRTNEGSQGKNSILVMHWNARSIRRKVEELKKEIEDRNVRIVCIQESSLPKNEDYHPKFKNFRMFNLSRDGDGVGGGLITLVHRSLAVEDCSNHLSDKVECIKTKIRANKDCVFTLFNVYIPSQGVQDSDLSILLSDDKNLIVVGDFNSKHVSWNSGHQNGNGPVFFKWVQSTNMMLLNRNKQATYQSPSTSTLSTLDLSLASPDMARRTKNWHVGNDLGSDHFPVFFEVALARQPVVQNPSITHGLYEIRKADWGAFREATRSVHMEDVSAESIERSLLQAADLAIPKKKPGRTHSHMNNWWNDDIKSLRNKRQKARRKWKHKRTIECRKVYNKWSAKLRKAIFKAKRDSWRKFVGSINSNTPSTTVWKKFRAIEGATGKQIDQVQLTSGEWISNDVEKAAAFNDFYRARGGRKISWPKFLSKQEMELTARFEFLFLADDPANKPFTLTELKKSLSKVQNTAPGADNIHNEMLRHCSTHFLQHVVVLFNNIWKKGNVPQPWKTARIIPVPKRGKDVSTLCAYRPIALTSCLGKLLEQMVNNRLVW